MSKPEHKYLIQKPGDIPDRAHWAIICFVQVTEYTGYENEPGYSTGGSSTFAEYYAFTNQSEWEAYMRRLEGHHKIPFVGIYVKAKARIQTHIKVDTSEPMERGGPGDR